MIALLLPIFFAANVLTLDEALKTADTRRPALRQSQAQIEIASARADEARSELLPQISARASITRTSRNRVNLIQQPKTNWRMFNTIQYAVTGTQVLFDFGLISRWRAAEASARAAGESNEAERHAVALEVRLAFFGARARRALLDVSRDSLENQQKHLETVQGFVDVGARPQIDLAQARGDTANAKLARIRAENDYETAKAELNQAMGVETTTDYDVADDTLGAVDREDDALAALLDSALRTRPDLVASQRQIEAARIGVRAAQSAYGPSLTTTVRADESGPTQQHLVPNIRGDVTLNVPIFSGLLTTAQVHEARATVRIAELQRDVLVQQLRLDLDKARLAVRAAKAEQDAAEESLAAASERLRLAEGRYRAGNGNILELDDAQLAHTQAAAQKVQAEYDLASARAQLVQALGR